MLVKQLSVFMENRPGRLSKLTHTLGKEGIDFVTLSIADTKDFGIVRFIARENERAYEVLKREGFTVGITELIGVEVDDKPNALAEVVALIEEADMNIEYLYSFVLTERNTAKILMRVDDKDTARAVSLLTEKGIRLLSEKIL
ncbi:MAG TPA: ACT domain-containing protein [Candidatus Borkfalkia avicola]|uniref:ACT domain-containing protein n=1 Tax=Candidatus Borkfalkia avicola TaxID=2838503 RepID=A0A9D2II91_9FIRM|nr:ACT domain-containing protein [Candidatus Borkfalkia avicola]